MSSIFDRQDATQIVRSAAGLDSPDLGETLQGSESGFVFGSPSRYRLRTLEAGDFELSLRDSVILGDASGGVVTLNLPPAAKGVWRVYTVKKIDGTANTVDVVPKGAETVDGSAPLSLSSQYEVVQIISDGDNWWKV